MRNVQLAAWTIENRSLSLAGRVRVSVQRTRPLAAASVPPRSYGAARLAANPSAADEVLVGIGDDDAFWLGFTAVDASAPAALRVIVDEPAALDAVTGQAAQGGALRDSPQNYVVCPLQRALDGVRVSIDCVAQFVTRAGSRGTCSLLSVVAVPSRSAIPAMSVSAVASTAPVTTAPCDGIRQAFVRDPYGRDYWDESRAITVHLRIVPPQRYAALTGDPVPEPLDEANTYRGWRLP
jgi:hypothetical protein